MLIEAAERLGMTLSALRLTPLPVRLELWKITQELLSEIADEFGAMFVAVPASAFSNGALAPRLSVEDASHANGLWAEIMVREATRALGA